MKRTTVKAILIIFVSAALSSFLTCAAYAHGVIYEQKMVGENTLRVTLKWSDPQIKKGINISSYVVRGDHKSIDIAYEVVEDKDGYNTKDFDLNAYLRPVCVRLFNVKEYDKPIFSDLKDHYAESYIHHLHDAGIVNGKSGDLFKPGDKLTRAEFMILMTKALNLDGTAENTQGFKDVDSHWARSALLLGVKNGLLSGYPDKTLHPNDPVTVAQVSTVISRAFKFKALKNGIYDKLKQNAWYSEHVKKMFDAGVLKTSDKIYEEFSEQNNISRADCAMMVSRALSTY